MELAVDVQRLCKNYGSLRAVDNVSFRVEKVLLSACWV